MKTPFSFSRSPLIFWALILALTVAGCAFPGSTKPVIKVGLVAPFEGAQRADGYQRLYGVKLALQETNLGGGAGGYKIELVALNDYGDQSESILQAQELVIDSKVYGVIGPWEQSFTTAVRPIYDRAQMLVIDPARFTDFSGLPVNFEANYTALAGNKPERQARQAYLATRRMIQQVQTCAEKTNLPLHRETLSGVFCNDAD